MMKLIWTDNLNTGIDVIDNQHKRIVDYINKLYSVHNRHADKAAMRDVIFDSSESVSVELNILMVTWLFNHILHEDAKYVSAIPKSAQPAR